MEHFGEVQAALGRDTDAPGLLELVDAAGVFHVLEAGQAIRDRAHVAAALDVILTAQRIESGAVAPDVTGQQREIDERANVVDGVVMLGDAERPADLRAIGAARTRARARE